MCSKCVEAGRPAELPCPDECLHVWEPPRGYAGVGPMEGSWQIRDCRRCNSMALSDQPGEPGSAMDAFLRALELRGCEPRPDEGGAA